MPDSSHKVLDIHCALKVGPNTWSVAVTGTQTLPFQWSIIYLRLTINAVIQCGEPERCKCVRGHEVFIGASIACILAAESPSDALHGHHSDLLGEDGIGLLHDGYIWHHVRKEGGMAVKQYYPPKQDYSERHGINTAWINSSEIGWLLCVSFFFIYIRITGSRP